ncbi:MAG: hypothetical protein JWR44_2422 [Hymenobacter sp.]|jgi:hypothetical protein|nr:hypothetical protein [Hymenobacter sp.]
MRFAISLAIPQPCHESWAVMTPASSGRHCAACKQTVIDFTLKTDAEILAYLATAAGAGTCGRFAAGQLERPLQRAAPAAPTVARWRAWLAAVVAVWGLREGASIGVRAQVPVEQRARYWGGPVPVAETASEGLADIPEHPVFGRVSMVTLRGVVLDSATREGLPGATVLVKGTIAGVSSDVSGHFSLELPLEQWQKAGHTLAFSSVGYVAEVLPLPVSGAAIPALEMVMRPDNQMLGEVVLVGGCTVRKAWPWHPQALFNWSRYQVRRAFQR